MALNNKKEKRGSNNGKRSNKRKPVKKRKYSPRKLQQALEEVEKGTLSARKAAEKFGVPRSTVGFRFSPKFMKTQFGTPTVLTSEEESTLVKWVIECSRKGFPRRRLDLQQSVQGFLEENPRKNPFSRNRPGKKWLATFLRRHPELTYRTSEAVTSASSTVSMERIKIWFRSVEELLVEEGFLDVLQDPSRIFNGDETNFLLWPKNSKVLAEKGSRNVYEVDGGVAKSSLTVMFSFSADGTCVPPMIVYPYKRLPQDIINSVPAGWGIGRSETGWMTSEIFYEYIANIFSRFLDDEKITKPVILFVDGHKSHLNYQLSQLCTHLKIILVALYPNSTRILQPADVAAFKPLKEGWKKAVLEWRIHNPNTQITRVNVGPILKSVVETQLTKQTLKNGFRASGIFPWNPSNIDPSKCLGSDDAIPQKGEKSLNHEQFINLVGDRVVRDVTTNCFENGKSTPIELFNALKSLSNFFETSFQNEVRKPAAGSSNEGLIVIEVPAVVGKTIEVGEPCVSTEDVIMMDPSDESTGVITSKNLKLHSSILMDASPEEESEKKDASSDEESREKKDDSPKEESGKKKSLDPIVLKKTKHGPIEEWLVWPKTPEKKGKRIQKMMPYVITSESWKAEKKEEIERKEEARKAKEERTLKKSKNTKPPAKKNVSKKLTIKNGQGKESKKKGPQRQLFAQNHAHSSKAYQYSVEEHVDEEEVELRSDSEEGHMRMDGPEEPLDDLIINDNNDFIRGMCFTCTRSLNATNPGRSCDVCEKLFHNNCEYLSEDGQLTICQSCNKMSEELQLCTQLDSD